MTLDASSGVSCSVGMVGCGLVSQTLRVKGVVLGRLAMSPKFGALAKRMGEDWPAATTWHGRQLSRAKRRPVRASPEPVAAARPVPSPPGIGPEGGASLDLTAGAAGGKVRALSAATLPGEGGLAGRVTSMSDSMAAAGPMGLGGGGAQAASKESARRGSPGDR
jgi:hypothetical protein